MTATADKARANFSSGAPAKWRRDSTVYMAGEADASAEANGVTPELAAMVPQQLLHEDEVVILLTKPSLFFIFYSSAFFVFCTLLLGIAAAKVSQATLTVLPSPSAIATATGIACVGRVLWALLVWTSHVYMLTNQRIVTIKGVVNTHMFQTHLRKVQRTDLYRPLVQKIFGTGTIGIATASAAGGPESTWIMIARPLQTHEQIIAAINKANGGTK